MDLYEVLDVDKTATQAEIKTAFKKLAKVHHPDAGGDAEAFNKINTAYEVLHDENKRKRYDDTGLYGTQPDADAVANAMLMTMFEEVLNDEDSVYEDVFETMRNGLKNLINDGEKQSKKLQKKIDFLLDLIARIGSKEGSSSKFTGRVNQEIDRHKAGRGQIEEARQAAERALELLKGFTFDKKVREKSDYSDPRHALRELTRTPGARAFFEQYGR